LILKEDETVTICTDCTITPNPPNSVPHGFASWLDSIDINRLVRSRTCWLPGRDLVVTADSSFAALELLEAVHTQVAVVSRLRLDATPLGHVITVTVSE
jgi:hypothetical protein